MEFNLADLFEGAVDAFPDREYLVAEGRRLTYADMEELIRLGAYRAGSSQEVDEAVAPPEPV